MVELLSSLREPPVVGRFYMVPVVRFNYMGIADEWPVIGPKHSDADFFKFEPEHYHVDARFLRAAQERAALACTRRGFAVSTVQALVGLYPLSKRADGALLPKGRPPLARRKCVRSSYGHSWQGHDFVMQMQAHFGKRPAAIELADGRKLCPHRKADLSQFPANADGMVTCPLHGLRVCVSRTVEMSA